jgi:hypothetical protein
MSETASVRVTICLMCAAGFHEGCTKPTTGGCCCQAAGMSVTKVTYVRNLHGA